MSMICARISSSSNELTVEPVGDMAKYGYLPGTFVRFTNTKPRLTPTALATIDRCGNTDWSVGFVIQGTSRLIGTDLLYANDNEPTGRWTPDESVSFVKDNNAYLGFDDNHQASYMGTGVAVINLSNISIYKFYVYEKFNKLYRDTNGSSGGLVDWDQRVGYPGLYVSSRGLLTTEKEHADSPSIAFVLASVGEDDVGKYVLIVSS